MTARDAIFKALYESPRPLALHELPIVGINQAAASARLREMRRLGIVQKMRAPGMRYDLWRVTPAKAIPLTVVA